MTNQEAIEVIKLAQAQVEWEYPMDYATAFDMAISALHEQEAKNSNESSLTQKGLDTISRQAAIDAVEHITSVCVNTDERHGMKRMQRQAVIELANMPSAQPEPHWIPVSERLPDKEGNYLITAQPTYNHAKDIRIAHWSSRWVGYVKSEIIAWMPLPEPYRKEGD